MNPHPIFPDGVNLASLQQLVINNNSEVRDFTSWADLLDALHRTVIRYKEQRGENIVLPEPYVHFGFPLGLFDDADRLTYANLAKFIELGIFPVKVQCGLRETADEINARMKLLYPEEDCQSPEDEELCSLCEVRGFIICYAKKDTYEKLKLNLPSDFRILDNEGEIFITPIQITIFKREVNETMADHKFSPNKHFDRVLAKTTPDHRADIMSNLVKIYIIDEHYGRPVDLFDAIIAALA